MSSKESTEIPNDPKEREAFDRQFMTQSNTTNKNSNNPKTSKRTAGLLSQTVLGIPPLGN